MDCSSWYGDGSALSRPEPHKRFAECEHCTLETCYDEPREVIAPDCPEHGYLIELEKELP